MLRNKSVIIGLLCFVLCAFFCACNRLFHAPENITTSSDAGATFSKPVIVSDDKWVAYVSKVKPYASLLFVKADHSGH